MRPGAKGIATVRARTIPRGTRATAAPFALATLAATLSLVALAGCETGTDAADRGTATLEATRPPAATGAGMPFVAADAERFYLSWTEPTGETGANGRPVHAVRFAWVPAGGGDPDWSEPRTLAASDNFFVNWADFPSIAAAGDGRLAAHWLARSGEGTYDYDVVVSASTDGGERWSEPRIMHADGVPAEHGFLSFFPHEDGFGAVWLDGRATVEGGPMTLRGGRLDPDGTPRDLWELDDRICDCCQTGATVTSEGPLAVYRGRSADEIRDILAVRLGPDGWEAPRTVHDDGWEIPACPVNGPAVDALGRSVVTAWFTGANEVPRVRATFSTDAGATWGPPIEVDEGTPLGRVDVLHLDDGSALVVWLEAGDEDAALLARRIHPDGRTDPATPLATTRQARASGFPRMARSGDRILLSWTEPGDGGGTGETLRAAWLSLGDSND